MHDRRHQGKGPENEGEVATSGWLDKTKPHICNVAATASRPTSKRNATERDRENAHRSVEERRDDCL